MTTTFFDANGNYYETLTDREPPEGHKVAPPKPSGGHVWKGGKWVKNTTVLPEQVNSERERRLIEGSVITVAGYGDIPVQGRDQDQITILALEASAKDMKASGVTSAVFPFRDRDNGSHMLTPDQVIELMSKAKQFAQQIYVASWALKDMAEIPEDYRDDKWWP